MRTIEIKLNKESYISRINGLFPFYEYDEFGNFVLNHSYNSIDGCYGKIIPNLTLPSECTLEVDKVVYLRGGEVYSYRTLFNYYYEFKDKLPKEDKFKKFIEEGIGFIVFEDDERKDEDGKFYQNFPRELFLSKASSLLDEVVKMRKLCEFYKKHKDILKNDIELCCVCEKYDKIGGAKLEKILPKYISLGKEISNKLYENALNTNKKLTNDIPIDLQLTYEDIGLVTPVIPIWIPKRKYNIGDKVLYDNKIYICKKENSGKYDEETYLVGFDHDSFEIIESEFSVFDEKQKKDKTKTEINILGRTDSKLTDFRRNIFYRNENGVIEVPDDGVDWLFFYRKKRIYNIKTITDDLGNIVDKTITNNKVAATEGDKLFAYGDIIEDIKVDNETNTITFIYRLGVHLKGEGHSSSINADKDVIHNWENLVIDETDNDSIVYKETVYVENDTELYFLMRNELKIDGIDEKINFEDYVNGVYDISLKFHKFPFIKTEGEYNTMIVNNNEYIVKSYMTDFSMNKNDNNTFFNDNNIPLIREDYNLGITYRPTKNIDVRINRGVTSVFQKHIAFSEIKTMEDLLSYQNGSFFKTIES